MTGLAGGAPRRFDVVVVGAGIVGLAAAMAAVDLGLRVAVIDRDEVAVGASVRNFGHVCTTVQSGLLREYADTARSRYLELAADGVITVQETGTLVVAREADEYEVLRELAELRGDEVQLLSPAQVGEHFRTGDDIVGGALLPRDLRVDPRTTVAQIAAWLAGRGVTFLWSTHVQRVEAGRVVTATGSVEAAEIVVAVGHEVDLLYPDVAAQAEVSRCTLSMATATNPLPHQLVPAVLTGFSMLRYSAFAQCPSLPTVRERLSREAPQAIAADLNLMTTALPDGSLIIGDTHRYQRRTISPFPLESDHELVVTATAALFGADDLDVLERWQGVYASAPNPYLVARPEDSVTVVSVTTGVGMTTAFGFVSDVLASGSAPSHA